MASNFSGKKTPTLTVDVSLPKGNGPLVGACEPGDRVYVFLNATPTHVHSLGGGTLISYEGKDGCHCPRIQLDQGGLIFGCDIYFGKESGHEKFLKGREIIKGVTTVDEATGYVCQLTGGTLISQVH